MDLLPSVPALVLGLSALMTTGARAFRVQRAALSVSLALAAVTFASRERVANTMLLLVLGLGLVVSAYSRTGLRDEPRGPAYARSLTLCLASVGWVVTSRNLGHMFVGWTAVSFFLHPLLTFFEHRPEAALAAFKKFVVSRTADLFLLVALTLLYRRFGTLDIPTIDRMAAVSNDDGTLDLGCSLLAVGFALRAGLAPFQGWLVQMMEAPTPVSALLHAGIVNLGGFVCIQMRACFDHAPVARALLVVFGSLAMMVAALTAASRTSIKVSLAWSTSAQMGLMFVECALGAYSIAFAHLLLHSLYKAYAFLTAGSTVRVWRSRMDCGPSTEIRPWVRLSLEVCLASIGALALALCVERRLAPFGCLVGFAVARIFTQGASRPRAPTTVRAFAALAVLFSFALVHIAANAALPGLAHGASGGAAWAISLAAVGALLFSESLRTTFPEFPVSRWILQAAAYVASLDYRVFRAASPIAVLWRRRATVPQSTPRIEELSS